MVEHKNRRPLEVVDRAFELLLAHDMVGFAGLWATDGVMEFPFAPADFPQRLDGRAAVTEYLRDYTDHVDLRTITSRKVHQTLDPEVVIVEFAVDGTAVRTGRRWRLSYISVITVQAGEIAHYRDYWNPLAAAEAMGGSDELTSFGTPDGAR